MEPAHDKRLGFDMKWIPNENMRSSTISMSEIVGNHTEQNLLKKTRAIIASAQEILIVTSFLITSRTIRNELVAAANRGVRIYVLTAAETALKLNQWVTLGPEKDRVRSHEQSLVELSKNCLVRSDPNWHAKYVIRDPHSQAEGIILSANLNEESLIKSPELGVLLEADEISELFQIAKYQFWNASHEIRPGNILSPARKGNELVPPPEKALKTTVNDSLKLLNETVDRISQAKDSILLSTYNVDGNCIVIEALAEALTRGVHVKLICHPSPQNLKSLTSLAKNGAEIYGLMWIHAKLLQIDKKNVYFMSQNLDAIKGKAPRMEIGLELNAKRSQDARSWLKHCIDSADQTVQL